MTEHMDGLREADVPADMLPDVRRWWDAQLGALEKTHGAKWPDVKDWLFDYMNAEVRERIAKRRLGS